jgi:hypothetical protein
LLILISMAELYLQKDCPEYPGAEQYVMDTIGEMISEYFARDKLAMLRKLVEQEVNSLIPKSGNEIDQVESRLVEIERIINSLIDNMTSVNREFVDKRIIELKREKSELEGKLRALEAEGKTRIEAGAIIDEAMAMATDYKRIFEEDTIEEKRFFLRAFLTSIKLDPETGEGEAKFVLLPGMNILDQKLSSSRLFAALPHKKDLPEPDRSSRLFIALPCIVDEQITSNRLISTEEKRSSCASPLARYWKLNSVITLWELLLSDGARDTARHDFSDSIIPTNLQN